MVWPTELGPATTADIRRQVDTRRRVGLAIKAERKDRTSLTLRPTPISFEGVSVPRDGSVLPHSF